MAVTQERNSCSFVLEFSTMRDRLLGRVGLRSNTSTGIKTKETSEESDEGEDERTTTEKVEASNAEYE